MYFKQLFLIFILYISSAQAMQIMKPKANESCPRTTEFLIRILGSQKKWPAKRLNL